MDLNRLSEALASSLIGHKIVLLEEVDSTNVCAAELGRKGADEGTVVIADSQTSGKGRLGRSWQSPPGVNLYASIILRPEGDPVTFSGMTLAAGVAVAETIRTYCREGVALKWPNDVQIKGRKVCGILSEMQGIGGSAGFMVIGIGVNINIRRSDFQEELRDIATSLLEETGRQTDRTAFVALLLERLLHWYRIFLAGDFTVIRDRWLALSAMVGKQVRVTFHDRVETGRVIGMDEAGALLLEDEQGGVQTIMAGDVSLRENC
jgi:BirA family transcriptional regulator, biotin operon repressor / biotin---[acetyl-CoA-carboxylase] ligase